MRKIETAQAGPVRMRLDVPAGRIRVSVGDVQQARVTLSPVVAGDRSAIEAIETATVDMRGQGEFAVTVPVVRGAAATHVDYIGGGVRITRQVTRVQAGQVFTIGPNAVVNFGHGHGGGVAASVGLVEAEIVLPAGSSMVVRSQAGADLEVRGSLLSLDVATTGGRVDIQRVNELQARTVGGDVRAEWVEVADLTTTGGDVSLGRVGRADVTTLGGDIRIPGLAGQARLNSGGGDIWVHAVAPCRLTAASLGGDITVTAAAGVAVDTTDLRSLGGRITRS